MKSTILNKNRQAPHIAPLQPLILAAFRPWGGSAGAGRVRPAGREDKSLSPVSLSFFQIKPMISKKNYRRFY